MFSCEVVIAADAAASAVVVVVVNVDNGDATDDHCFNMSLPEPSSSSSKSPKGASAELAMEKAAGIKGVEAFGVKEVATA